LAGVVARLDGIDVLGGLHERGLNEATDVLQ
jgi:hypothetical protein